MLWCILCSNCGRLWKHIVDWKTKALYLLLFSFPCSVSESHKEKCQRTKVMGVHLCIWPFMPCNRIQLVNVLYDFPIEHAVCNSSIWHISRGPHIMEMFKLYWIVYRSNFHSVVFFHRWWSETVNSDNTLHFTYLWVIAVADEKQHLGTIVSIPWLGGWLLLRWYLRLHI